MLVFDFDGVFTDGKIVFDDDKQAMKHYNAKDGMGIFNLHKNNIPVCVISGWRNNKSQKAILEHLKIDRISLGSDSKNAILSAWCEDLDIDIKNVAYMGDDLNDLEVMSQVGFVGCPLDAVDEVKNIASFISSKKGGEGCVREFCDYFIKIKKRENAKISCVVPCAHMIGDEINMNTRKFETTTLLEYKLNVLEQLNLGELVLSTNDQNIINTYRSHSFINVIEREADLCLPSISYKKLYDDHIKQIKGDVLFHTTPISPFLTIDSIKNLFQTWISNPDVDMVMFGKKMTNIMKKNNDFISLQQLGFICNVEVLKKFSNLSDIPNVKFIVPNELEEIIVNSSANFVIAESLLYRKLVTNHLIDNYVKRDSFTKTKLFDCTIRDSGYMNNWNWSYELVKDFVYYMGEIGVDYCEIGFIMDDQFKEEGAGIWRSINNDWSIVKKLKDDTNTKAKIAVLFDIGDYETYNYDFSLIPNQSETQIDIIRVCCFYQVLGRTEPVIECLHKKGYNLTLNVMYASHLDCEKITNIKSFVKGKPIEYLYFADSIGGLIGNEIQEFFTDLKDIYPIKNGFHNHDNQGTVFNNISLLIDTNIDMIDTTIGGIGKNGGNCPFELTVLFLYFKRNYKNLIINKFLEFLEKVKDYEFTESQKINTDNIKTMIQQFMNIHPSYVKKFKGLPLDEYYLNLLDINKKSKW